MLYQTSAKSKTLLLNWQPVNYVSFSSSALGVPRRHWKKKRNLIQAISCSVQNSAILPISYLIIGKNTDHPRCNV